MSQAYAPGLKVARRITHRVRRSLPIPGEVLVAAGQQMAARDIVARTYMPGDITPLNVANLLAVSPGDVPSCLLKREGERVDVGDVLARTKGLFGLFKAECHSPAAGTIESISNVTGQVMLRGEPLPVQVDAFLAGNVVEVIPGSGVQIEADATLIQGIFGIGGEAFGPIRMACRDHGEELSAGLIVPDMRGTVVVGGARVTADALTRAVELGVAAIVTGGIDDQDLRDFLGYDLGVAITGSEKTGITLIITEGFGEIAMAERTFHLFAERAGSDAAVNGATQIRAGVMRPEVLIPWGAEQPADASSSRPLSGRLQLGAAVRIIRDPYFGMLGDVQALPPEPRVLASGSQARVLEVRLGDGSVVVVPRANVELIEG